MGAKSGWILLRRSSSLPRVCDDRGHQVTALILKLSERHAAYLLSWHSDGTLRTRQALDQNKASIRLSVTRLGEGRELRFSCGVCGVAPYGYVCAGCTDVLVRAEDKLLKRWTIENMIKSSLCGCNISLMHFQIKKTWISIQKTFQ